MPNKARGSELWSEILQTSVTPEVKNKVSQKQCGNLGMSDLVSASSDDQVLSIKAIFCRQDQGP